MMALGARILALALLSATGCAAQGEHFDDRDWTKDHGIQTGAWREVETLFGEEERDSDQNNALRGVRLDLTMTAKATPDTRCHCLDVVIGQPTEKKFAWAGPKPNVGSQQMALAIRTEGSKCTLPDGVRRRPSIQAVDTNGRDVIVVIEELPYDRPQALGAVIQKPHPEGRLYVRSRRFKNVVLPYAHQGLAQNGACLIKTDPREHHQQFGSGRRF
jgi:hypothetical protein